MSPSIASLFDGMQLTRRQSSELFAEIISGHVDPVLLGAILVALKVRGESVSEIVGAVDAVRVAARPFERPSYPLLDIVGTGGDGAGTINVSTAACIVAAAAGAKVVKHGNRSASGRSGSSDLMEQFGVNLQMQAPVARHCLDRLGLTYLYAPFYHSGFRNTAGIRKTLGVRTIFNLVGPLVNPVRPDYLLLGVFHPDWIAPMAEVLCSLGVRRAMVVHCAGLDEIGLHGPTQVAELQGDVIRKSVLVAEDFGVASAPLHSVVGGSPAENFQIAQRILGGGGTREQRDIVAANAGAALYLAGIQPDLPTGTQAALNVMSSGIPLQLMLKLATVSHQEEHNGEAGYA